jgi:hypothetical protein
VLREPEVGDERLAVGREEDVLRLHVAVDDPQRVSAAEGDSEHTAEAHGLGEPERSLAKAFTQRPPGEERHDEEQARARVLGIEERNEPFPRAERRVKPSFTKEARRGVAPFAPADELDGNFTPVPRAGAVDDASGPSTQLGDHLVSPEPHGRLPGKHCTPQRARANPGRAQAQRRSSGR